VAFSPIPERANRFAYRDMEQHKRIVSEAYAGIGWRVPQLLEQLRATDDLYFDAVSLVDLRAWSKGRITLAGDAGSCVPLLGDGSSLAIAGAHPRHRTRGPASRLRRRLRPARSRPPRSRHAQTTRRQPLRSTARPPGPGSASPPAVLSPAFGQAARLRLTRSRAQLSMAAKTPESTGLTVVPLIRGSWPSPGARATIGPLALRSG
jgi:hypothetical protein